jgi:very-short-patch-repair endonuclease
MNKLEKFLQKVYTKHSNKYDYSLVEYVNSTTKIKIICPIHGIFEQSPGNHTRGQGCPRCAGVKGNTKEDFVKKANIIHSNKYDYSLVEYINNKTKVKIICPEHGIFETRPDNHTNKPSGCPKCANNQLYTKDVYIERCNKVHNNKYDYSLIEYKSAHNKIKIICPEHGVFVQDAYTHINGVGCPKCSNNYSYTTAEYIDLVKIQHNNKYDYSLVEYVNSKIKIKIICPIHGVFEQDPSSHLKGVGCHECYVDKMRYNTEKFIELSKKKHGNKYDYSLVEYEHSKKNVKIICPNHGVFEQKSGSHIKGDGCPVCKESKGEKEISILLENKNIDFIRQKYFDNCKDDRYLPFDFYLPEHNICIEFDGLQHFKPIEYFGGEKTFKTTKKHDKIKNEYCADNGIKLIRIKYNECIENKLNKIKTNYR